MKIVLDCVPPTATSQQKNVSRRGTHLHFYKPPNVAAAEQEYAILLMRHRPREPLTGPLSLSIVFTWPHPQRVRAASRQLRIYKTTPPDLDNAGKLLGDSLMRAGFFEDDSQIVRLSLEKCTGPDVGIVLELDVLTEK